MIGNTFFFGLEASLIVFLQAHLVQYSHLLIGITELGGEVLLVTVMGFFYWCYDKNKGKVMGLIITLGLLLSPMIKNLVLRRRPYFDIEFVRCIEAPNPDYPNTMYYQGFSLPSSHATNSMMIYGYLAYIIKRFWAYILAMVLILLVGLSRVFLGVHFPTDILVGWIIGLISIAVILVLSSRIKNQKIIYLILLVVGLIGLVFSKSTEYYKSFGFLLGIILSFIIEEKYIQFRNTKNKKRMVLRLIGGIFVFGISYVGLKLILPEGTDLISSISFVLVDLIPLVLGFGIYPLIFKKFDRYFREPELRNSILERILGD